MDIELPEYVNMFVHVGQISELKMQILYLFRDDDKCCTHIHLHSEIYAFDVHFERRFDLAEKIFSLFSLSFVSYFVLFPCHCCLRPSFIE